MILSFCFFIYGGILFCQKTISQPRLIEKLYCYLSEKDTTGINRIFNAINKNSNEYEVIKEIHAFYNLSKNTNQPTSKTYEILDRIDIFHIILNNFIASKLEKEREYQDALNLVLRSKLLFTKLKSPTSVCEKKLYEDVSYQLLNLHGALLYRLDRSKEAESIFRCQLENIDLNKDPSSYYLRNYSIVLMSLEKLGEAALILEIINKRLNGTGQNKLIARNYRNLAFLYGKLNFKDKAILTLEEMLPYLGKEIDSIDYFKIKMSILLNNNQIEAANSVSKDFYSHASSESDIALYNLYKIKCATDEEEVNFYYHEAKKYMSSTNNQKGLSACHEYYFETLKNFRLLSQKELNDATNILKDKINQKKPISYLHKILLRNADRLDDNLIKTNFLEAIHDSIENEVKKNIASYIGERQYYENILLNNTPKNNSLGKFLLISFISLMLVYFFYVFYLNSNIFQSPTKLEIYYRAISHDIRFPLEKLNYFIATNQAEKATKSIDEIQFTIHNLIQLFNIDQQNVRKEITSLKGIAKIAFENLSHPKKTTSSYNSDLKEKHFVNEALMYHLFLNAFHNAMKHSSLANPKISIIDYKDGNSTYIEITNTTKIDLQKSAEKNNLKRTKNSFREGFGLQIIKTIVSKLNGSFEIKLGKNNTLIRIRLPL